MDTTHDVIVIGAGLAGLTAAATAKRAGASVLVVDRQGPGGRASSDERGGALVNRGAHALYKAGPAAGVLQRLGVNVRGSAPPLAGSAVLLDGQVHRLRTNLEILNLPWLGRRDLAQLVKWMTGLAVRRKPDHRLAGVSAATWLASRELRPRAQVVAEAAVRVTSYCSDLASVSADAIAHQLAIGLYPGVRYLDGGWNQLVTALREQVGTVRQARAESVVDSPGGYVVRTDKGELRARSVVAAVESEAAARRLLDVPGMSGEGGREATPPAESTSAVTVACLDLVVRQMPAPRFVLGLDEPVYLSLHSPPADLQAPGASAPESGRHPHVVHLMRYGARSAEADRPLLEGVARLAGIEPGEAIAGRFLAGMVVMSAPPSPARGGLAGRPEISAPGLPGCFVAGDWVGPDGMLADTSFASGERAGRAAASHALRPGGARGAPARRGTNTPTPA